VTTLVQPSAPGPPTAGRTDPSQRGRLTLAAQVLEKIAGQAAGDIAATGGTSGGVLGVGAKQDLSARPRVAVRLVGQTAEVDLDLGMTYPTPLRSATDFVREHVTRRVLELTGVRVTRVDIRVLWLKRATQDHHQTGGKLL